MGGVGWGEIVDTLVVTAAIVVIDEGGDLGFEIAREEVVLQQDAVLEGLVPALHPGRTLRQFSLQRPIPGLK